MKKLTALILIISVFSICASANFSDTENHWAQAQIQWASDKSIVNGYPDGSFLPENYITRAEALKPVAQLYKISDSEKHEFYDVQPGSWYYKYTSESSSVMPPFEINDGKTYFKPEDDITRQDAVYCIIKAKFGDKAGENTDVLGYYNDSYLISEYAKPYVAFAINQKIVKGYEDNILRMNLPITRAEFVTLLYTADSVSDEEQPQPEQPAEDTPAETNQKLVSSFIPVISVSEVTNESGPAVTRINGLKNNEQIAIDTTESYVNSVKAGDVVIPNINHKYLAKSCTVLASLNGDSITFGTDYMKGRNTSDGKAKYYYGEIEEITKNKNVTLKNTALSNGSFSLDFSVTGDTEIYFYDKSAKSAGRMFCDSLDYLETEDGKIYAGGTELKAAYTVAREIDGDIAEVMIYIIK